MASYPSTPYAPASKSGGQTIQASFFNDPETEITALETALLTSGLAHDLKFVDATYDIGKSGATRPRDLFVSRNAVIGGTLTVTGVATFTAAPVGVAAIGTWTPSDSSGAGLVFTNVEAYYVKIGQFVIAGCRFTFPATADASNSSIGGLPSAALNTTADVFGCVIGGGTTESTLARASVTDADTTVWLYTTSARITNATLSGDTVQMTAIYRSAS